MFFSILASVILIIGMMIYGWYCLIRWTLPVKEQPEHINDTSGFVEYLVSLALFEEYREKIYQALENEGKFGYGIYDPEFLQKSIAMYGADTAKLAYDRAKDFLMKKRPIGYEPYYSAKPGVHRPDIYALPTSAYDDTIWKRRSGGEDRYLNIIDRMCRQIGEVNGIQIRRVKTDDTALFPWYYTLTGPSKILWPKITDRLPRNPPETDQDLWWTIEHNAADDAAAGWRISANIPKRLRYYYQALGIDLPPKGEAPYFAGKFGASARNNFWHRRKKKLQDLSFDKTT